LRHGSPQPDGMELMIQGLWFITTTAAKPTGKHGVS
jgi:hypothetical protein